MFFLISGICLYERFQKIQQRLREGQQSCDLLFYVALQSLKRSFEMAFESKQGISGKGSSTFVYLNGHLTF